MFYEQYPKLETVVNHNFECLVCDGSIIQPGVNSLADTDPNLCLEISPNEERRPETLHKSMAICIVQKWGLRTSQIHFSYRKASSLYFRKKKIYCIGVGSSG